MCAPLAVVFGHVSLAQTSALASVAAGWPSPVWCSAICSLVAMVVVLVFGLLLAGPGRQTADSGLDGPPGQQAAPSTPVPPLPDFAPPAGLGSSCRYPSTTRPRPGWSSRRAAGRCRPNPLSSSAVMTTTDGDVGLQLENALAPLHGQQLRQPGPPAILRQDPLPPADHRGLAGSAAVR